MTELTVVTTCKGRLHHLTESLPTLLGQTFRTDLRYRVVVVDYGCPQGAFDWCVSKFADERLTVVRVRDDVDRFNFSRARNIGAAFGSGLLAFLDADVLLPDGALQRAVSEMERLGLERLNHSRGVDAQGRPHIGGQFLIRSESFHALRGFCEGFREYGGEDIDLYRRSLAAGQSHGLIDLELRRIPHDDEERLRFVSSETKAESILRNREWLGQRGPVVNPDGYGLTEDFETSPNGLQPALVRPAPAACECKEPGWCERHRCAKTPHWHVLCRTRADYFALWEEGRGPGQKRIQQSTEPGLLRKAANFGKAVARHVADGGRKVSHQVLLARLEACKACPSCDTTRMVCRERSCGCFVTTKAAWRSERCPLGKWPKTAHTDES